MKQLDNPGLQIGLVSLPVMACILAAVLYGAQRQPPPEVDRVEQALTETAPQLALVRARLDNARRDIKAHIRGFNDVKNLAADNHELGERIEALKDVIHEREKHMTDSRRSAALRMKIDELEGEIAVVDKAVAALRKQKSDIDNRVALVGLNEFPRPYISIECSERDVVFYAPEADPQPVTLPLSEDVRARIRGQIAQVAGLVVFVRAAAFGTTYRKVLEEVDGIVRRDSNGRIETALSFVPVQNFEDIAAHVFLGRGP